MKRMNLFSPTGAVGTFAFEECNVARPCKFNYSNDSGVICSMMTGNAVLQINDTTKANQVRLGVIVNCCISWMCSGWGRWAHYGLLTSYQSIVMHLSLLEMFFFSFVNGVVYLHVL